MLPLSLYIHIPWCIRKCPYCDFNSHKSPDVLPEHQYIQALIEDLKTDISSYNTREINSIFIGGGTPSLFSAEAYNNLFNELKRILPFAKNIEITMEANPGTVEQHRFTDYRQSGINRLSLGIQSFNPNHLKILGRIHDEKQAHSAIDTARKAGFDNLNLDIMHSLPNQSVTQGLQDLKTALSYQPEHLSWYQLTIEPNTVFYKHTPPLPSEEEDYLLEEQGFTLLHNSGYHRYEISAFSKPEKQARHNINYWLFGDYLGIGAGAHGKMTTPNEIIRTRKHRQPKDYLDNEKPYLAARETITGKELLFEFMLNTTRLEQSISLELFTTATGLELNQLLPLLKLANKKQLINLTDTHWQVTPLGRQYTNDLQALFLP
ncbi:TPA: radical SAM family heme chaperone HemW [Legionella pneumophila subsp. pneumophila]|uniref:radical SAM family heme chaperone HemW n=1 Tax=Legionella pneumophila TaxID=446 RepID=UPI0007707AFD|nr:radical SAM family heme chaperone HemW [Legionella pneumophila]HAT9215367.1 radical SAM family heme chaperone HemW [Legionella pneumophila subsp. pneumophila]CZI98630.1 Oxygen-independent coproporphyrinogen-III oxidase [Legionella pneumophila]HAT9261499.1 radical SAM family heme chaperone HemW [Legionella pneumophila subsp. pneumophila]HAT9283629.1 radical SAM family heme chaperone HemW [Legionella pneumophila subsp. pneumophila]HAT9289841.1 radical SAM family heme chaperone HemW [Legionell